MKDSAIFYRSFFEAINEQNDKNQLILYKAIFEYALNGIEPNGLNGVNLLIWGLVKPQLDANNRKGLIGKESGHLGAEYGKLGAEYGKMGGRPKKDPPQKTPPKTPPKTPINVNDNENVNTGNFEKLRQDCLDFYNTNGHKYPHYTPDFFKEFIGYWGEKIIQGKGKGKCLYEMEKTWNLSRRLKTSYDLIWKPKQVTMPVGNSQHLITY
jgi:hypothetical protein